MTGSYLKIAKNLDKPLKAKSLQQVFSERPESSKIWDTIESTVPRESRDFSCPVFPLAKFVDLVDYVQYWEEKGFDISTNRFRFLIDENYQFWLAPEGIADNAVIPAHYQMTGAIREEARCFAAGNLIFSKTEPNKLIKISNKSGDFKPEYHSLEFLLALFDLFKDKLPFVVDNQLEIEMLKRNKFYSSERVDLDNLHEWILGEFPAEILEKLEAQPLEIKENTYSYKKHSRDESSESEELEEGEELDSKRFCFA